MARALPLVAILLHVSASLAYTPPAQPPALDCKYDTGKGATYDLSALGKLTATAPATVQDRIQTSKKDSVYTFGICRNIAPPLNCQLANGESVKHSSKHPNGYWAPAFQTKASEKGPATASNKPQCYYLGNKDLKTYAKWSLLDPKDPGLGVTLTYTGGEHCSQIDPATGNKVQREFAINFRCDSSKVEKFEKQVIDESKHCKYEITVDSEYACPLECGFGSAGNMCNNHGLCRYDTDAKKARCFCNAGYRGAGCDKQGEETTPTYGPVLGLLVFVTIAILALIGAVVFLWRYMKQRTAFNTGMEDTYGRLHNQFGDGLVENGGQRVPVADTEFNEITARAGAAREL